MLVILMAPGWDYARGSLQLGVYLVNTVKPAWRRGSALTEGNDGAKGRGAHCGQGERPLFPYG